MTQLLRCHSNNHDFVKLVQQLDKDLARRDGKDHAFYDQFNSIEDLNHCIVLYTNESPIACGAFKPFNQTSAEIKRMFTIPEHRGNGYSKLVLQELETWAKELSFTTCILETGKKQPEAISLYSSSGYQIIPNYGQYLGIDNSICFSKSL